MNKKKLLIGLFIILLVAGIIGGGTWAWKRNSSSNVVKVYPVEYLNSDDMYEYGTELTGVITSDFVQEVVPDGSKEIKKVYVEVGDVVKEGDKLLKYNVDEQELTLKLQKLQIDASQMQIENMEKELDKLKNTKPVKGGVRQRFSVLLACLSPSAMAKVEAKSVSAKDKKAAAVSTKAKSKKKSSGKKDTEKKKKSKKKKTSKKKNKSKKKDTKKKDTSKKGTSTVAKDSTENQDKASEPQVSAQEEGEEGKDGEEGKEGEEGNSELDDAKIAAKKEIVDVKTDMQSYYVYDKDKSLSEGVVTDYCGSDTSAAAGGKIGAAENVDDVTALRQQGVSELTKIAGYSKKRTDAIKEIDAYLADKKYGKADEKKKDSIYETYCGNEGKIATAADDVAIAAAKEQCLSELKALEGGPLYTHIDDAENQQSANSGNGSSAETTMRYLLVKKNGKEPTIAGLVVNQFFTDLNYMGRYIEFRVYSKESDYPEGTPELVYQLTPNAELNGVINFDKNYTVPELEKIVTQEEKPEVDFLLKKVTKISQHQAGKGTLKSKYKYYLKLNAPIKGSVIKNLIKKKKYAVFRDYTSEDSYAAGADPKNTITITPDTLFSKTLSSSKTYTIKQLNKLLVKVDSVKVTPQSKGLKKVVTGNSYQFNATVKGKNTSALTVVWSLKNAKSNSTRISTNGLLTVASDEKASALKVTATAGGKSGSYLVTVKKGSSTSRISTSTGSKSGSDSDSDVINTYTAEELKEAIEEKEQEIAEAKQELNEAKITYREEKKEVDAAIIRATIDGKVTVATMDPPIDSPAVVIRGDDGMYCRTAVSELDFDTVKVGGLIEVISNETGEGYQAVIKEISEYPVEGAGAEFGGNPNSSYYPVMAYIEQADGLRVGERVTIKYDSETMGTSSKKSIYLNMAYVRTEGKQAYVYKAGKDGRLEKAPVKTGKVIQGQVIEILSGLSEDDAVAFPYGKNVKEGAKTVITDDTDDVIL